VDINKIKQITSENGVIFLTYGGFLSQTLIASMTEALEKEAKSSDINMGVANNIFTVFIELSQNMMNYSKDKEHDQNNPQGLILVGKNDGEYFVYSQNIVTESDKNKIEPKLCDISKMDRDSIKKLYRELRRSGKESHSKGGGIGFLEIAKRSSKIEFDFVKIPNGRYNFSFKSYIRGKREA
jgi:hypothetical protein